MVEVSYLTVGVTLTGAEFETAMACLMMLMVVSL